MIFMTIENTQISDNDLMNFSYPIISDDWKFRTGKGIGVAIIDSGIDDAHPDLTGKVRESVEAQTNDRRVDFIESKSGDSAGHGTACAGIITSIAPDCDIYSIKVLGAGGAGDGQAFLAGLEYAVKRKIRLINLSLGTTRPQLFSPLHDLLDRAYQAGCVIVAAANNLPQPSYPSVFSSSLIAVSKSGEKDAYKFSFKHGEIIELTAPGINVRTTWIGGGYRSLTGNSFACPHIVGIIAKILEACPELTPFQVKSVLYSLAQKNKIEAENSKI